MPFNSTSCVEMLCSKDYTYEQHESGPGHVIVVVVKECIRWSGVGNCSLI